MPRKQVSWIVITLLQLSQVCTNNNKYMYILITSFIKLNCKNDQMVPYKTNGPLKTKTCN